jgi:hypothetical protein
MYQLALSKLIPVTTLSIRDAELEFMSGMVGWLIAIPNCAKAQNMHGFAALRIMHNLQNQGYLAQHELTAGATGAYEAGTHGPRHLNAIVKRTGLNCTNLPLRQHIAVVNWC